jgi:hypothetical protein
MKYIRNDVRNEAEWYSQRLTTYLCNNTQLFPEYSNYDANDLFPSTKAGGYNSGIYFKKRRIVHNNFYPDREDYEKFRYDGGR